MIGSVPSYRTHQSFTENFENAAKAGPRLSRNLSCSCFRRGDVIVATVQSIPQDLPHTGVGGLYHLLIPGSEFRHLSPLLPILLAQELGLFPKRLPTPVANSLPTLMLVPSICSGLAGSWPVVSRRRAEPFLLTIASGKAIFR